MCTSDHMPRRLRSPAANGAATQQAARKPPKEPVHINSLTNIPIDALFSHDFVPRGVQALAQTERTLRRAFTKAPRALYVAFCLSSFTYSVVGMLMVLLLNPRLPSVFITSVPIGLNRFSLLLVAQGPVSWWADVWARTYRYKAHHVAYLVDRLLATSLTILTFFIGNVCWRPHSTPTQRGLAGLSLLGLVPFALSQRALVQHRFVGFMAWHVCWHVSIPVVAITWLAHTAQWDQ